MIDPTQTQPLSWRIHQGKVMPSEDVPVEPPSRLAPTFDDSLPERLSERGYRLRARLGSGRLGSIYEAQDELSRISGNRHFVAILLVDAKIASRPGFDADFERGAADLKSIAHPNIVRLLEYGCDQNRYYLVNELLESASLRFVLNDAGTLPVPETTSVLRAVGDALQYLHAKGMVHGNLRPENVLVTFGYEVKLLDVVPNGWLVNPNDALGVPARAPDKRDDVFGLGCLAYEMLSGRHPFNGNTAQEAYRAGLEAEPIDGLGGQEWRALSNALSVHRDDRTPNVGQFLEEFGVGAAPKLKNVVAGAGAPAPAYSAPPPTYAAHEPPPALSRPVVAERPSRERPQRRGVLGGLFALLAVIGVGAAVWYYQEPISRFATDLASEVDARMKPPAAAPAPAKDAATASVEAPLEQAPTVTDDTPATVLAPGAQAPAPAPLVPEVSQASPSQASPTPDATTEPAPAEAPPAQVVQAPVPAATPGPARFSFPQAATTVRESDVAARILIRRSGSLSGTATVSWWTADGSARADADYADLGARLEQFAPGEESRTVFVPLTNDAAAEPAKSFTVFLGRGESAANATAEMRVDIVDDD